MARRASQAVAGFFPCPERVVHAFGKMLRVTSSYFNICDPCAGEGVAVALLRDYAQQDRGSYFRVNVRAIEMEGSRYASLKKRLQDSDFSVNCLHGDFFHLNAGDCIADLMWLNPPYDHDSECGRLEEKFLRRALRYVCVGGVLAFVVPVHALYASVVTITNHFTNVRCWKFPEPEYSIYKQVILVAERAPVSSEDREGAARLAAWIADPTTIPTLTGDGEIVIAGRYVSPPVWEIAGFDDTSLKTIHPWISGRGPVANICPPIDLASRMQRTYPVASVPRASHLAAALSAGIFNGVRVEPDTGSTHPPILVKGTFTRDYRTIEERTNTKGQKVAEVQVQQPKLSVSILDLSASTFHTLRQEPHVTGTTSVGDMTLGDLLDVYGQSLMRAMLKACPVLHDPKRGDAEPEIEGVARPLYPAQLSAVHTGLKVFKQRDRQGVVLLGEIGSGKSSVALATAIAMKKRRILIMCPPHLLDGWRDQVAAVTPQYQFMVIDSIADARSFAESPLPTIGVLSRERAKLGHSWISVDNVCPKCGVTLPDRDFSIKRERCAGTQKIPHDPIAQWVARHVFRLYPYMPGPVLQSFIHATPSAERFFKKYIEARPMDDGLDSCLEELSRLSELPQEIQSWLAWTSPGLAVQLASRPTRESDWSGDTFKKSLLFAVDPGTEFTQWPNTEYGQVSWDTWQNHYDYVHRVRPTSGGYYWHSYGPGPVFNGVERASLIALHKLIYAVVHAARFKVLACQAPLYQAVPDPRRYPIATWLCHNAKNSYDMLVLDEAHELSAEKSAQANAATRLQHGRADVLLLTGSFLNGYADSAFSNMYAVSPQFRAVFGREDRTAFIDRYGYWKRIIQEKDGEGRVVAFGTCTDRVQRSVRKAGVAPGILPLFLLDHLLPVSVTLQKEDLRVTIPPTSEVVYPIAMSPELERQYKYLLSAIVNEIKRTRFTPNLAGKLWGAMAHLPSFLDRAGCGVYEVKWPANIPDVGGQVICSVPGTDPNGVLPKEQWMLDQLDGELSEGRNVLVFGWHMDAVDRIVGILRGVGVDFVHLDASRVATDVRQAWIDKNVVRPNKRVLVVNPVAVQTGLNNLVHFHTSLWMENPGVNPTIYRQAEGRTDRIGQTLPTRFKFPYYVGSAQEQAHKLLMHKVGVALGVDGLDPVEALRAAGVLDDSFAGFSIGREIYRMIVQE